MKIVSMVSDTVVLKSSWRLCTNESLYSHTAHYVNIFYINLDKYMYVYADVYDSKHSCFKTILFQVLFHEEWSKKHVHWNTSLTHVFFIKCRFIWLPSLADLEAETAWFCQLSPYPAPLAYKGSGSNESWTWCSMDSSLFSQHAHRSDGPCSGSLSLLWFHVASKE